MRATWLPDVLRADGLIVEELPGWRGRGDELVRIDGLVEHGFGARYEDGWTDAAFDRMLMSGRPDLPGPLSQLGLDRDGHFVMVADGKANHNGYGLWGNQSIAIEVYGKDRWTAAQLEAWPRGSAAILRHLRYGVDRDKAHRETDPRRKVDPVNLDMDDFRRRVAAHLTPSTEEETLLCLLS